MHLHLRRLLVGSAALASLLLFAASPTFAARSHTVSGDSSGTSTAYTGLSAATCHPTAPTNDSTDLVCAFNVQGEFSLSHVGHGAYSGQILVDYHAYTNDSHCGSVSGTITFQAPGGTLTTQVGPNSTVCETSNPNVHTTHLVLEVTGGTHRFHDTTGKIYSTGTSTATSTSGVYDDAASLSGSLDS